MSSQRRQTVESLRDTLLSNWPGETPNECLEEAERADSSTDEVDMRRCPRCFSVKVLFKPSTLKGYGHSQRKNGAFKCGRCRAHFSNPHPPITKYRQDLFEQIDDAKSRAHWLDVFLWGDR